MLDVGYSMLELATTPHDYPDAFCVKLVGGDRVDLFARSVAIRDSTISFNESLA